jgi:putative redox protein
MREHKGALVLRHPLLRRPGSSCDPPAEGGYSRAPNQVDRRRVDVARTSGDDRDVSFEVEFRGLAWSGAAIGCAGPYTLVVDRPADAGGQGLGFNGGQLLYLAIGGCISNDLFREASARGIRMTQVGVRVVGELGGEPAGSEDVINDAEVAGDASREQSRSSSLMSTRSRRSPTRCAAAHRSSCGTSRSHLPETTTHPAVIWGRAGSDDHEG